MPTRFDDLLRRHLDRTTDMRPPGLQVWDAHTHLGVDEDGFTLSVDDLLETMRAYGVGRAFSFPLNDPDRRPGYRVPNDRVLRWAAESGGAIVPFCRLDLTEDPIAEAERCLDAGARGIKLHPRAQAFDFGETALNPVFQLAAERRVPILIHAGRGLPAIADDLRNLVEHHSEAQLILAHGAIADLEHIARTLNDHPNVLYDTSVWSSTDLRTLLASASPEQVVFASDLPYGMPGTAQLALSLVLHRAGATEAQTRAMFWGNAERAARGEPAESLSPPLFSRERSAPLQRLRIHDYLVMTQTLMWSGMGDRPGALGLALRACDTGGSSNLGDVAELLEAVQALWSEALEIEDEDAAREPTRAAMRLLQIADALVLDV
ncbi:MAG: amidohydrolase family protein [Gaiellales bacterium]